MARTRALYALAHWKRLLGDGGAAAALAAKASRMRLQDASLAKEAMELLVAAGRNEEALELSDEFSEEIRSIGRVKIYIALAHCRLGHIEQAEAVLYEGGGIVLPDIREGERTITDLYLEIAGQKAARGGLPFDPDTAEVPPQFDYRQCDAARRRPARKRAR